MQERIDQELALLRKRFPALEYVKEGQWIRIPSYPLPSGWSKSQVDVAFQIPAGYPGAPPYGIYTPIGLTFNGQKPDAYTDPAPTQPPFPGTWALFSWTWVDGQWRPTTDLLTGCNLQNWVLGFAYRFKEGK